MFLVYLQTIISRIRIGHAALTHSCLLDKQEPQSLNDITYYTNYHQACHTAVEKLRRYERNSKSAKRYEQTIKFRRKVNKSCAISIHAIAIAKSVNYQILIKINDMERINEKAHGDV